MRIDIISLFPGMFGALTEFGVSSRAVVNGLAKFYYWNPRDYTEDRHRTVDDRPYGGGPGMVMKAPPLKAAIDAACANNPGARVIALSPQGKRLDQKTVKVLSQRDGLILLAGRYEGIDERILDCCVDEQFSIGDYVLSGGELPAMVLADAVIRLLPGALGNEQSADQDSFENGLLDTGHYTRPETFMGQQVPEVLLSGDHQQIARWRLKQALGKTWLQRPDLLQQLELTEEQSELLNEFQHDWQLERVLEKDND